MGKHFTKKEQTKFNNKREAEQKEKQIQEIVSLYKESIEIFPIFFQLIPPRAFGQKVKTIVGDYNWQKISKKVRESANYTCAYCGEYHPEKWGTDAHEEWDWDFETGTQKLKAIKCVCKKCHMTVHPGANNYFGRFSPEDIIENFCKINKREEDFFTSALTISRVYQSYLNQRDWKLEEDLAEKVKIEYLGIVEF